MMNVGQFRSAFVMGKKETFGVSPFPRQKRGPDTKEIAMSSLKTKEGRREWLRTNGFVRVDGLISTGHNGGYRISAATVFGGKYDSNNGVSVVYTNNECWIRRGWCDGIRERDLCPNGHGAFVPCSNGEQISFWDMMSRIADPDWMPGD